MLLLYLEITALKTFWWQLTSVKGVSVSATLFLHYITETQGVQHLTAAHHTQHQLSNWWNWFIFYGKISSGFPSDVLYSPYSVIYGVSLGQPVTATWRS